jgi:hypothetical protein
VIEPATNPSTTNLTTEIIMPIDHFAIELPNGATPLAVIKGLGFDYYVAYNDFDGRYWLLSHEAEDFEFEFDVDFLHDYRTLAEALAATADLIERDLNADLANPISGMIDRPGTKHSLIDDPHYGERWER